MLVVCRGIRQLNCTWHKPAQTSHLATTERSGGYPATHTWDIKDDAIKDKDDNGSGDGDGSGGGPCAVLCCTVLCSSFATDGWLSELENDRARERIIYLLPLARESMLPMDRAAPVLN